MIVSKDRIKAFSSKARDEFIAAIVAHWGEAEAIGLGIAWRAQHFMAQIATETGGLKRLDENLNYSAAGLLATFPSHFSPADAQRMAGDQEAIADRAYANRLGNGDEASGDGWRFRGSGYIQLTGRINFRNRGRDIGMPLEQQPDLARSPEPGFHAAIAFWKASNVNAAADANDIVRVRKLVNGGANGLADAGIWFARAQRFFRAGESEPTANNDEIDAVKDRLAELGFASPLEGTGASDAVAAFQDSKDLKVTGEIDDDTLDAIVDQPGDTVPPE